MTKKRRSLLPGIQMSCWAEFCVPHGLAVAKSRVVEAKRLATQFSTLTKSLKDSSFKDGLADSIAHVVRTTLRRQNLPRPDVYVERAARMMDAVLGDKADYMFTTRENGTVVEKPWIGAMRDFLAIVDLEDCGTESVLTHWSYVSEADVVATGRPVGAWSCDSFGESVDIVPEVVNVFMFGRCWGDSSTGRWA